LSTRPERLIEQARVLSCSHSMQRGFPMTIKESSIRLLGGLSILLLLGITTVRAEAPFIDPADDEKHFGSPTETLFWTPEQQVAGYRNSHRISPTRKITAGKTVLKLPYAKRDLDDVKIQAGGIAMTVDEYFTRQSVAGLLVIKDGKILYERYGLGNTEDSRWISFSVSKSVVSMLFGAALQDGFIDSVDEKVTDYLPRLKGSSYDQSSIKNVLQMASGVEWNEDYTDPESDVARATWATTELYEYLRHKPRESSPGEIFNYNTAETNLAGTLLRSAIGNNLSTYLTEKIWKPFGMEADAYWNLTEPGGGEFGGCCLNATLRDYGRIGLFALNDGRLIDGTEVLPADWLRESTSPSKGYAGYGYFWWLTAEDIFTAIGIFGQGIYINREQDIVIALHSARGDASKDSDWALQDALYAAITDAITD
jgi:CubicO group peptidase (beta-lactamase class C family)